MVHALIATADILLADEAQSIETAYRRLATATQEIQRLQQELEGLYERERRKAEDDGREASVQLGLQVLADIDISTKSFFRSIEQDIAALSIAVAERIVGKMDEPDRVFRAALQAVKELSTEEGATIYVSTAHYGGLVARLEEMRQAAGPKNGWTLQADAGLEVTDCRLETARGVINVGIARQFDTLRQSIQPSRRTDNIPDTRQG